MHSSLLMLKITIYLKLIYFILKVQSSFFGLQSSSVKATVPILLRLFTETFIQLVLHNDTINNIFKSTFLMSWMKTALSGVGWKDVNLIFGKHCLNVATVHRNKGKTNTKSGFYYLQFTWRGAFGWLISQTELYETIKWIVFQLQPLNCQILPQTLTLLDKWMSFVEL